MSAQPTVCRNLSSPEGQKKEWESIDITTTRIVSEGMTLFYTLPTWWKTDSIRQGEL